MLYTLPCAANVVATVTLPVKSPDEAKALVATLTQLAASGALDSELRVSCQRFSAKRSILSEPFCCSSS